MSKIAKNLQKTLKPFYYLSYLIYMELYNINVQGGFNGHYKKT